MAVQDPSDTRIVTGGATREDTPARVSGSPSDTVIRGGAKRQDTPGGADAGRQRAAPEGTMFTGGARGVPEPYVRGPEAPTAAAAQSHREASSERLSRYRELFLKQRSNKK